MIAVLLLYYFDRLSFMGVSLAGLAAVARACRAEVICRWSLEGSNVAQLWSDSRSADAFV